MEHQIGKKTGKRVLVIIDMQNDFVAENGVLSNEMTRAVLPKVVRKLKVHYNKYDAIYLTRDIHFENYLETLEGKKLPIPHCIRNTDGKNIHEDIWNVVKELRKKKRYIRVIDKHTFGSKELIDYLSATCGTNDIVEFVGVCTNICVVGNAIPLRMELPNTIIRVDANCCAGTTVKDHNAALRTMNSCQIDIIGRHYGKKIEEDTAELHEEEIEVTNKVIDSDSVVVGIDAEKIKAAVMEGNND